MHTEPTHPAQAQVATHDDTDSPSLSVMHAWNDRESAALVALLKTRPDGLTWSEIAAEVADARSAHAVWDKHRSPDLFADDTAADALAEAVDDIDSWQRADFRFLTFMDSEYPRQLLEVHQFPPVLFTKGTLRPQELGVSVVGSRAASAFGIHNAKELARLLTEKNIAIVSGLAAGIDTAAHLSTLSTGGRTVAVIGTGINRHYPSENSSLQNSIARTGLVMSQFWPDAPPSKSSFPIRNATMSAYGRATIVVEAGEQSGARIQARLAVAHGRPVILMDAVVRGTNWGAKLRSAPGVLVADSPEQAVEHVERIVHDEGQVSDLLARVPS